MRTSGVVVSLSNLSEGMRRWELTGTGQNLMWGLSWGLIKPVHPIDERRRLPSCECGADHQPPRSISVADKGSAGVDPLFFQKSAIINQNPRGDPFYKTAKVEAWSTWGGGVYQ